MKEHQGADQILVVLYFDDSVVDLRGEIMGV